MTVRFAEHLLSGVHSALPAAADAPEGTLYSCTDHSLIYKNSGVAWSTWATLGSQPTALLPPVLQTAVNYYASGDPHAQTVTAPTGATILVVHSEVRAPTGVTQTNVTWTQRYAGSAGSLFTTIYTGAITGAAGTSISVDYASSTKAELIFIELDLPALTTVEASTGNSTGAVAVTNPPLGTLCVAADGAFNANGGTYIVCTVPHRVIVDGGCIMVTIFYFVGYTRVNFIQSATRHTSLVALS